MENLTLKESDNPGIIFHQERGIVTYDHMIRIVTKFTIPQREDMVYDLDINRFDEFEKNDTYRNFIRLYYVRLIQTKIASNMLLPNIDHNSELSAKKINKYTNMKKYSDLELKANNVVMLKNEWNDELWAIITDINELVVAFNSLTNEEYRKAVELIQLIKRLENKKFESLINYGKFIENSHNTNNVSDALSLRRYQQVSSLLRVEGSRLPIVRSEADLNKVATLQISSKGKFLVTEVTAPALKQGYIEV
ncbi:hypothetical protein TKK_0007832 [Trichogramma kaykai]